MKPSQLPPEALQSQIRNGSAVQIGDEVSIVTVDGREHAFTVSTVGADTIEGVNEGGARETVPIDDVLALRTQKVDVVRTGIAAMGGYMVVLTAVLAVAFAGSF